jgi:hypothetical protein
MDGGMIDGIDGPSGKRARGVSVVPEWEIGAKISGMTNNWPCSLIAAQLHMIGLDNEKHDILEETKDTGTHTTSHFLTYYA